MRRQTFFYFILLSLIFSFSSFAAIPPWQKDFSQIKNSEPTLRLVVEQYFHREHLGYEEFKFLKKRAHRAPLLPTLYLGYDHQLRQVNSLSVTDNISISSGNVTVGPEDNNTDWNGTMANTFRTRAVWALDELVFSRYDLAIAAAFRDRQRQRGLSREEIGKLWEARQQFLSQYLLLKKRAPEKAGLFYAKYVALTERLDEMTGFHFHKKWWREK